jgi:hypothetical protein
MIEGAARSRFVSDMTGEVPALDLKGARAACVVVHDGNGSGIFRDLLAICVNVSEWEDLEVNTVRIRVWCMADVVNDKILSSDGKLLDLSGECESPNEAVVDLKAISVPLKFVAPRSTCWSAGMVSPS